MLPWQEGSTLAFPLRHRLHSVKEFVGLEGSSPERVLGVSTV